MRRFVQFHQDGPLCWHCHEVVKEPCEWQGVPGFLGQLPVHKECHLGQLDRDGFYKKDTQPHKKDTQP